MATTTSTSSFSALGSGSGLDLSTLLTNIVAAERDPQQAIITQKQTAAKTTVSALGALKSAAASFQSSLTALKTATTFQTRTAKSSDASVFSVTADATAEAANYSIGIINLASGNKIASGNFANAGTIVGNGTLTVSVGSKSFDVTIDGTNNSISGIRDAINNASDNSGVKASLLTISDGLGGTATKLILTANSTGADSQIGISVADGSDANNTDNLGLSQLYYSKADALNTQYTEVKPALDAKISIDGFTATSSTNVFDSAITGVKITALKGPADALADPPTADLSVAVDQASVKTAISKFVSAYNAYIFTYKQLTAYDATTDTAGPLQGNSSVSVLGSRIRQNLGNAVVGASADFSTLASIGITTNSDGTLKINDTKLDAALSNHLSDAATLFSGNNGVAGRLDSLLSDVLGSTGLFQNTQNTLDKQLADLTTQQTDLDARMTKLEATYRAQFVALDSIVAQLKQTGTFLTQQLAASTAAATSS